jgi:preprotein translocase subunit SecD
MIIFFTVFFGVKGCQRSVAINVNAIAIMSILGSSLTGIAGIVLTIGWR